MNRRTFVTTTGAAAIGFGASSLVTIRSQEKETVLASKSHQFFWPDKARLVISISMQFETGAQPDRGAGSPFPSIEPKYADLPVQKWYDYGFKEGVPRLLDLWDRAGVKVTSHMVGQAVETHPELAKEIVERGHEASGHGQTWEPQYSMTPEQERAGYQSSIDTIQRSRAFGRLASMHSGCAVHRIPWVFSKIWDSSTTSMTSAGMSRLP